MTRVEFGNYRTNAQGRMAVGSLAAKAWLMANDAACGRESGAIDSRRRGVTGSQPSTAVVYKVYVDPRDWPGFRGYRND